MKAIDMDQLIVDITDFLKFKRSLGLKYERNEFILRSFERFVQSRNNEHAPVFMDSMLSQWLARCDGRSPKTVSVDFGTIHQMCLYRRRRDPSEYVPDRSWMSKNVQVKFLPYVFSFDEMKRLLHAAQEYKSRNISATTLYRFILVLYCTGLRPGEGARLRVDDVDLDAGLFTIRQSKGKSRLVPFGDDLLQHLTEYRKKRQTGVFNHDQFWVRRNGSAINNDVIFRSIRRLFRQLGIKPARGRVGPRPYDIRHSFAVHRLTKWYEQGLDIHAQLPWLSAYMGHDNVLGTEVYLHATPELMGIASDLFANRVGLGAGTQ